MDFITADWHLRHGNILKHSKRVIFLNDSERKIVESGDKFTIQNLRISRESSDRMNDVIIDNVNKIVNQNDRLWILGDLVWCRSSSISETVKTWRYYREKINCLQVFIIWGNHDPKVDSDSRRLIAEKFSGCYDLINTKIDGQKVILSHYAMAIWDGRHHGSWHLYGHSHAGAEKWLDEIMPGRFSMDCGIDNAYKLLGAYRPFSWTEIRGIMAKRPGFGLLGQDGYHHKED